MFSNLKRSVYLTKCPKKRFMSVKRKYPINPEEAKQLPVFDYGSSKKSYRRVFVWGNLQSGALGVPYLRRNENVLHREVIAAPKRLGFAEKFPVTTAACGFGFTAFAVDTESGDKLYGTGLNTDSQIGRHEIRQGHPLEIIYFPQPIHLPVKSSTKIRRLAAGRAHLVVLTDEGVFLLGNNSYGQCGREIVQNEDYFFSNYINHIAEIEGKKITDIDCGQDHTLAVTEDGAVYSCGWGADGQTGLGIYENTPCFTRVRGDIESEKIVKISSRCDFVLALNSQGEVFAWGNAEYGQIPTRNNEQQVSQPTHLTHLKSVGKITDVAAGGSFCLALNEEGQVFAWGYGLVLGGPKAEQSSQLKKLPDTLFGRNDFQPNCKVVQVAAGLSYAMAVTNLGDIYAWGRNMRGCLGLGIDKDQYFPFKVSLGGYGVKVFCGYDHTVAICKPFI